ncbi:hypothetical protein Acr_00g0056820 [Actinidia rufa]|uniref:Disease resistance N-terminal domain-containing protein n=1 Tax=Actinidia rufa TaxID=165716 RepID=A0A7J0DNV0_9ERIC|nr:hypothetical protein Acr_00g0056820 [Actinidia rufa]
MVAVGEIFLSAFLQVLFQKLASREMLKFFHREKIHTKVMNWTRTLLKIRAVLDDAEEKQITNKFVNLWLEELQDLAYDLDDLLDEFSTKALLYNLSEKSQFITSKIKTCMGLNPAEANLVHDITIKLQDMSKQIGTLGLHVVNISRTPIQDRERLPTTSATYERRIYGRDSSKTEIINLLLNGGTRRWHNSNYSSLPQLGQLRLLKKLLIEGISWEYWYPYVGEIEVRAFPHLFELSIKRCPKLVSLFEEEEEEERQQQQQMEGPSFMMRLEFLKLQHCEKLEKLPRWLHTLPFLGELEINSCPSLVSFPEKGLPSTLRKLEISECGALEFLPEWMLNANYNLEVLKVDKCTTLKYIIRGVLPPSLKHIKISNCGMLESLVAVEGMKIICPSLESFNISSCNNLKFLPDALDDNNLKNLRRFLIKGWILLSPSRKDGFLFQPI